MYKQSDIIKRENIPENECDICYLHEQAYKFFEEKEAVLDKDQIECPCCNMLIENYSLGDDGKVVVGGHNGYDPDEKIGYYKVYKCDNCGKIFALIPQEIKYNANHDIFYTGGKVFLNESDRKLLMTKISELMTISTRQFVERVRSGERGLSERNLQYWNQGDLENAISEFLYEREMKI